MLRLTIDKLTSVIAKRFPWVNSTFPDGDRFWERGRLVYNGFQLAITAVLFVAKWPESRFLFSENLVGYFMLALISNALYTLAYVIEAILQIRPLRPYAQPVRWLFLIAGTFIACALATVALEGLVFSDPAKD